MYHHAYGGALRRTLATTPNHRDMECQTGRLFSHRTHHEEGPGLASEDPGTYHWVRAYMVDWARVEAFSRIRGGGGCPIEVALRTEFFSLLQP